MHHHFGMHVVDPEIIVAAVAEPADPRHGALLGVGVRNGRPSAPRMLFLDDAECDFAEVPQLQSASAGRGSMQVRASEKGDAKRP
jgi:hypothetical protein